MQVPHWMPFWYTLMNKHETIRKQSMKQKKLYCKYTLNSLKKATSKRFHRNQKDVGMALVNKVRIQVWIPLQLHVAPYIAQVAASLTSSLSIVL